METIKWLQLPKFVINENTGNLKIPDIDYCSWSPALKMFCLRGRHYSYLIDTQGQIHEQIYYPETSGGVDRALWGTLPSYANKLSPAYTLGRYAKVVLKSQDGINWEGYNFAVEGVEGMPDDIPDNILQKLSLVSVTWIPKYEFFIGAWSTSNSNADKVVYITTSPDYIHWKYLTSLPQPGLGNVLQGMFHLVWSEKKQMLLAKLNRTSYITKNFVDWVEIPYPDDFYKGKSSTIWSDTFKTFINLCQFSNRDNKTFIHKLVFS